MVLETKACADFKALVKDAKDIVMLIKDTISDVKSQIASAKKVRERNGVKKSE